MILLKVHRLLLAVSGQPLVIFLIPLESTSWWRHQMESFSTLLDICADNSPVNSLHIGQWRRALMFSLVCAGINVWVNNREVGDLRRHFAHHGVTVMQKKRFCWRLLPWFAFFFGDDIMAWKWCLHHYPFVRGVCRWPFVSHDEWPVILYMTW